VHLHLHDITALLVPLVGLQPFLAYFLISRPLWLRGATRKAGISQLRTPLTSTCNAIPGHAQACIGFKLRTWYLRSGRARWCSLPCLISERREQLGGAHRRQDSLNSYSYWITPDIDLDTELLRDGTIPPGRGLDPDLSPRRRACWWLG